MSSGSYGRKYHIKPRFYIILAVALALLGWGVWSLLSLLRPQRIEWGRLSNDQAISAIVLRDETLVESKAYAKLDCLAAEGEAVKKDQPVAMLYVTGYSDKDLEKLIKFQAEIKDYQENNILKNIVNSDLDNLNGKINAKMDEISQRAAEGKTQNLLAYEKELKDYMEQRRLFMLTIVKADVYLQGQYKLEENLKAKIDETRQTVKSPADGLLSFYLDGSEGDLTVHGLQNMTPDQAREMYATILRERSNKVTSDIVATNQAMCRIVNPNHWYALAVLGNKENPLTQGNSGPVTFDGLAEPVDAKAVKVVTEGRFSLLVLEMSSGAKEMLSLRLVNGHIGRDISGFLVPVDMLKEDGGKTYITFKESGSTVKVVEVSVLAKDSMHAIIADAIKDGALLAVGSELVKP